MAVTVVIVDDHPAFRASARRMLEAEGFEIAGEASNGTSALQAIEAAAPDVVLLDIALPDISGFEVAERLADSSSKVVLTSSRARSDFGPRLRTSHAVGFISKDELSGDTIRELLERAA